MFPTLRLAGCSTPTKPADAAPAQHEQGYYEAFGIRAGDRMWLDPNDRVAIW